MRVEQLYPFPAEQLAAIFERYPDATEVVWVQEEPENMGAWHFVGERIRQLLPDRMRLSGVSRFESGSPATGSHAIHDQEQQALLEQGIGL
ncbi:MAG: hypothetical protein H0U53_09990 [Actinobacteria bacterium]|nr:hypothetical protein [Actinomycetota bacterium]